MCLLACFEAMIVSEVSGESDAAEHNQRCCTVTALKDLRGGQEREHGSWINFKHVESPLITTPRL